MRLGIVLLACAVAVPVCADEVEQLLLPVAPSVVMCARNSRYETRLVVYNQNDRAVQPRCAEDGCGAIAPKAGREIHGGPNAAPIPSFLFLPKSEADHLRLSLVVESGERDHPENNSFAELPVVRASEFREGIVNVVGVRLDAGYRQTVRIYGLDGTQYGEVMLRVYDLDTGDFLAQWMYHLWPLSDERNEDGLALRPSFGMECDMSSVIPSNGQNVRVELEPLTPGLKFWAFVSVTNNVTQHFYTITPR